MTEKLASSSIVTKSDEVFKQSAALVDENALSAEWDYDRLLERFRARIDDNKKEIFKRHQLQDNEYYRKYLEEPDEEEMPRIIEFAQDGFYKGDLKTEKPGNYIEMNKIFKPYPDRRAKAGPKRGMRVTLTGPAGSGKTTILGRLARDATMGKIKQMRQKDHLVHQINCQELKCYEKISVADFLFKTMLCKPSEEELKVGCKWMQENPQKITFIIDSLDTMGYSLKNETQDIMLGGVATPEVILHNILTGKLFRESFVLSSSREHEIRGYEGALRADKLISLAGLKKQSIQRLTIGFLGQEEGQRVFSELNAYPGLMELCKTPVFLIFTIIGLKKTAGTSDFVPNSMAGVLVKLINNLSESKHAQTRKRYSDNECIAALNKMKNLAYNGTMNKKVLYTEKDLKDALLTKDEMTDLAIIVPGKVEKSRQILETGAVSFFIHQTVGELFCALKICEKDLKDFCTFVRKKLFKSKFVVIKRLVCGILQNLKVFKEASKMLLRGIRHHEEKKKFLSKILREKFNEAVEIGKRSDVLDILHVIHESGDGGVGILPTNVEKIFLGSISLTPSDTFALGGSICNCSLLKTLNLCKCELTPETIQALESKLDDSGLTINEFNVSWNTKLGESGYSSLGRLGCRHHVDKLGMDFCDPTAQELDALDKGLGNAKVKQLDASMNVSMGTGGFAAMGQLLKSHQGEKFQIRRCELKAEEISSINEALGDAKMSELDISLNENLGVTGCYSIGRFVGRHEVNKLGLVRCKLRSEEVDSFDQGLGSAMLAELDISSNEKLGVQGLSSMGRFVRKHGVTKLEMRGCELKLEEIESFVEELGDATMKNLVLSRQRHPLPVKAICELLPKVTESLDLRWNELSDEEKSLLQKKLNLLHPTGLKIEIGWFEQEEMSLVAQKPIWDIRDNIVAVRKFSAEVQPSGKEVWVNDCIINFHEGSFDETTIVHGSLEINRSMWPPNYFLITPIINLTSDSELVRPPSIKASSWCLKNKEDVTVDVLRLPHGSSTWEVIDTQPLTDDKFF